MAQVIGIDVVRSVLRGGANDVAPRKVIRTEAKLSAGGCWFVAAYKDSDKGLVISCTPEEAAVAMDLPIEDLLQPLAECVRRLQAL